MALNCGTAENRIGIWIDFASTSVGFLEMGVGSSISGDYNLVRVIESVLRLGGTAEYTNFSTITGAKIMG